VTQANSVGLKPTNGHSPVAMSNGKIENNFFQRAKSKLYLAFFIRSVRISLTVDIKIKQNLEMIF
jgi:hypothetical protein